VRGFKVLSSSSLIVWMQKATELFFSDNICRPANADIGEVACVALCTFELFCGNKFRYAIDKGPADPPALLLLVASLIDAMEPAGNHGII